MADKNLNLKILLNQINERIGKAGAVIIIILSCAGGLFVMSTMPKEGGFSRLPDVMFRLFIVVGFGVIGGYFAFRIFFSKLIERFLLSLFYSRHFLRKIPPVLSVIRGKIAMGDCAEAENMLKELIRFIPTNAEAVWLLSQLYINELHEPTKAVEVLCNYFKQDKREEDDEISKMLFFLADICAENNFHGAAKPILERELKRKNYSDTEKKYIEARLNNLKDRTIQ